MVDRGAPKRQHVGRIKDARGRTITQLDPVAIYLLRKHDWLEAGVLQAIVREKGVAVTGVERVLLGVTVIGALLVIGFFSYEGLTGGIRDAPVAKFSSLIFLCSIPFVAWYRLKLLRFGKVAAAMLKYTRCPHCGYDIHGLPVDAHDGATICPECGCAWLLPGVDGAGRTPQ